MPSYFTTILRGFSDAIDPRVCRCAAASLFWALCGLAMLASGAVAADKSQLADPFLHSSYFRTANASDGVVQQASRQHSASNAVGVEPTAFVTDVVVPPTNYETPVAYQPSGPSLGYEHRGSGDTWQVLPDGLIYRSYQAGPRESRISTNVIDNHLTGVEDSQTMWEGTVGGRRGLLRYGSTDPFMPEGFQIDIEGAAIVRLNLDEERDVDASDFRFGVPLTWGDQVWQYKLAYYHLSSHKGDERLVRNPGEGRVNYVRDAIVVGASYRPNPYVRLYGEVGAAVLFTAGGAEPWEAQFGMEYSQPGVTGVWGTPFFATNAHLREELDFGGDWTTQLGWLWRGDSGSTFRAGLHYMNGKSTNYQWFNNSEEQIGVGVWYDF